MCLVLTGHEQLRAAHAAELESLQASHQTALSSSSYSFTYQLSALKVDLNVTQQDLQRSKAETVELKTLVERLHTNLEESKSAIGAAEKAATAGTDESEELGQLKRKLAEVSAVFCYVLHVSTRNGVDRRTTTVKSSKKLWHQLHNPSPSEKTSFSPCAKLNLPLLKKDMWKL